MNWFWWIVVAVFVIAVLFVLWGIHDSTSSNYDVRISSWIPMIIAAALGCLDILLLMGYAIKHLL